MILSKIMLKCLCIFAILLNDSSYSFSQFHNQIDDVKTADDINVILKNIQSGNYYNVAISNPIKGNECQKLYDSLQIKTWVKKDFDNNGYTDLFVMGDIQLFYCILDSGNNKFYIKNLSKTTTPYYCELFTVFNENNFINYFRYDYNQCTKTYFQQGALLFKFGGFVEYNDSPDENKIQKIEFDYYGGELAPVIHLKIKENRRVLYQKIHFGKSKKINHHKINRIDYQKLIDCLNYIGFSTLNDQYCVNWLHYDISNLKITYNNGQIKKIKDLGSLGTFGLVHFYDLLMESIRKLEKEK